MIDSYSNNKLSMLGKQASKLSETNYLKEALEILPEIVTEVKKQRKKDEE